MHGFKNSEKRNSKEIEINLNVTRNSDNVNMKKQSLTNQNDKKITPCLSILIFPLISEASFKIITFLFI